jgi:hypothetical protein
VEATGRDSTNRRPGKMGTESGCQQRSPAAIDQPRAPKVPVGVTAPDELRQGELVDSPVIRDRHQALPESSHGLDTPARAPTQFEPQQNARSRALQGLSPDRVVLAGFTGR